MGDDIVRKTTAIGTYEDLEVIVRPCADDMRRCNDSPGVIGHDEEAVVGPGHHGRQKSGSGRNIDHHQIEAANSGVEHRAKDVSVNVGLMFTGR
jgi:hypothetical protein